MFGILKKPLNYLLTGSFSVVFAACYGAPVDLQNPKRINAKDDNEQPIQGLKVTLFENRKVLDEQFTNANGSVEFYLVQKEKYNYSAIIEDIDGPDNLGQFESEEINLNMDSFIEIKLNKTVK
jgi:hypothetical protein